MSRRSETKPDVPRDRIGKNWEGLGSIGKRAKPAAAGRRSAPASYTPGNPPAYTHYRPCWRHPPTPEAAEDKPAATQTIAPSGGNTPILSHTLPYILIYYHDLPKHRRNLLLITLLKSCHKVVQRLWVILTCRICCHIVYRIANRQNSEF